MKVFIAENDKRNKGFSLVELIVAIGILAVISTIVAFMMTSSSRNYSKMSVETQLQSEAQLVANAISEYAIDSYDAENISSESLDSQYDNTLSKILVLHSLGRDSVEYDYVIARTAENKLYLGERTRAVGGTWGSYSFSLLGNYITDFSVDTSHVEKDNIIDFQLSYTKNNRTYNGNYQVLMRNRAYADKKPENDNSNDPLKLVLGLQPKQIYIDIVAGNPGNYYYINEITDGSKRSLLSKEIEFKASVTSNKSMPDNKVEWNLNGADINGFELPEAGVDGSGNKLLSETAKLKLKDGYDFRNSAIDDFTISVAKSAVDSDGNTVSATSKQSKIHLRRVKSINLNPTSGYTSWKSSFDDIGESSSDAKSYAVADNYGVFQPMVLRANVIQKWVPYGGGLTWKIEMKQKGSTSGQWQSCPSSFASLQYSETDSSTVNTIKFGSNAKNGQLFKVTVTSKFDTSVSATYILGISPRERETGGGFNSRGFYVNLKEFAEEYADKMPGLNYGGNQDVLNDFRNGNITFVGEGSGGGGGGFENSGFKVEQIGDEWYAYLDYESFQYTNSQMLNFYSNCGTIELFFRTSPSNATVTVYYWIAPVLVHRTSPSQNFLVIQRGKSEDVKIKTDYYNIVSDKYFGIYVKNNKDASSFGTNLSGANYDLNPYLSCTVQSAYGDVKHYVDTMRVSIKAKDSLVYNPEPMTVRFTAEDYYKLCTEDSQREVSGPITDGHYGYQFYTSPCTDMTVYMANVLDQGIFIPGPATTAQMGGSSMYPLTAVNRGNEVNITVYKADGTTATAKTYKSGSQYKCNYAGNTYTYNPTYYYWYN